MLQHRSFKALCFLIVFFFVFAFFGGEYGRAKYISGVHIAYAAGTEEEDVSENKDEEEAAPSASPSPSPAQSDGETQTPPASAAPEETAEPPAEEKSAAPENTEETENPLEAEEAARRVEESLSGFRELEAGAPLPQMPLENFGDVMDAQPEPEEEDPQAYTEITDNPDGSHTAEIYFAPIKYKDDAGNWQEINPALEKQVRQGKTIFETVSSPVEIAFAANAADKLATISKDGYHISFLPATGSADMVKRAAAANALAEQAPEQIVKKDAAVKLEPVENPAEKVTAAQAEAGMEYQAVTFEKILNNKQDIVLEATANGVKEDIVLAALPEERNFTFTFHFTNLYPVLLEDGNVWLLDRETDEIIAAIPAPNMIDSSPEERESYDIAVSMEKVSETEYRYTLTPSREWLEDESRIYPVRIDPTVTYTTTTLIDTFVAEKYRYNNYVNDANIKIGNSGDLGVSRGYFAVDRFPEAFGWGKTITSATFTAYQNYTGASTVDIGIYQVPSFYNTGTINFDNQPGWTGSLVAKATVSSVKSYSWDITSMVKNWYTSTTSIPREFCLKNVDEGPNKYKRFSSAQHGTASQRPKLTVNYVDPPVVEYVTISNDPNTWTSDYIITSMKMTQGAGAMISEVQWATSTDANPPADSAYTILWPGLSSPQQTVTLTNSELGLPDGQRYLWFRGKNTAGGIGTPVRSNVMYKRDLSAPTVPNTLTATPSFTPSATGKGSITINWSAATDAGSGIDRYIVGLRKDPAQTWIYAQPGTALSYTFTDLADSSSYQFAVMAYDKLNHASAWKYSSLVTVGDYTAPTSPTSVSVSPESWTNNTSPTVSWEGITDANLAKAKYCIDWTSSATPWFDIPTSSGVASGSHTIDCSGLADGVHKIGIRGVDAMGYQSAGVDGMYYKDTTPPVASIAIPDTTPVAGKLRVNATITNEENRALFDRWELRYGLGTAPAAANLVTANTGRNTLNNSYLCSFDTSALEDNQVYSLYLYCWDQAGNLGISNRIELLKSPGSENLPAQLTITSPPADAVISEAGEEIRFNYADADAQNTAVSNARLIVNGIQTALAENNAKTIAFDAAKWDEEKNDWAYPEGQNVFLYVQGKNPQGEDVYSHASYRSLTFHEEFAAMDGLAEASAVAVSEGRAVLQKSGSAYAASGSFILEGEAVAGQVNSLALIVDENNPAGTSISYEASTDGGTTWTSVIPVSRDGGKTLEMANRRYFLTGNTGSSIQLRVTLQTTDSSKTPALESISGETRFTLYSTAVLVDNDFSAGARGFTGLYQTEHDAAGGRIVLESGKTEGTVYSTPRQISGEVTEVALKVEEELPAGTSIQYAVSADGGANYTNITPGDPNTAAAWKALTAPGSEVIVKAVLNAPDGAALPALKSWQLSVKTLSSGQPYVVKLVDEPENLSTLPGANYQTLLRWQASETQGVTYNIYRSETPYFIASEDTLIASGIEETSWSDYNLNYGKTFYYQVTACKTLGGHVRESLPSGQAWATVVDEDELQKRLGLQDYWSYVGFKTGGGDGYVNVSNGNLAYISTDMMVSDPFFAMVMRRTYNSLATTKTPLGYGWDFSFNTCLLREFDASGGNEVGMVLKDGDGSFHRFPRNADGTYASAKGTFMKLAYDEAAGEYTITRKDNIVYHFDAQSMKLLSFTNPNGNALTFAYDSRGNLQSIENTVGEKIEITYHVSGANPGDADYTYVNEHVDMVETVSWTQAGASSPESIVYHYVYGDDDKLDQAYTLIEGNNTYGESFSYGADGKLAAITNPEGNDYTLSFGSGGKLTGIEDPIGETFAFTYGSGTTTVADKYGVTNGYTFDSEGRVTKKTDALGHAVNYTFNSNFQVTGMNYQGTVEGSSAAISYTYGYDADGNLLSVSGPNGSQTLYEAYNEWNKPARMKVKQNGSTWLTTSYTYDGAGNLLTETDPSGKVITNVYAARNGENGYLISNTDRLGKKTVYTYNEKGQVTEINEQKADGTQLRRAAKYTYDALGRTKTSVDGLNQTTTYDYNKLGFPIKTTYADGTSVQSTYSLIANLETQTDARGNTTTHTYDIVGRPIKTTYADGTETTVSYGRWDSDGNGTNEANKVTTEDGLGRQTIQYYDKQGRLVKETGGGVTVQYEYDQIGNMTKVTDGAGRVTTAQYNALSQQTKVTRDPGGKNIVQSFTYDLLGNQLSATDGNGAVTSYTYDTLNRLKSVTQGGNTTTYAYDIVSGDTIKNTVTDARGNVSETVFDLAGRKTADRAGVSGAGAAMTTSYQYNANNQVTLVTRNDGSKEKVTYDSVGQTTRIDYYAAGADTSAASGYYLTYAYDDNGNVTRETVTQDGATEITAYAYDALNRVSQQTQGAEKVGALPIDYAYNAAGQLSGVSYPRENSQTGVAATGTGKQTLSFSYDSYGRQSEVRLNGQLVESYSYTAGGDLMATQVYGKFDAGNTADYLRTAYTYNSLGLVTKTETQGYGSVTGKKEQIDLTYDNVGNILTEQTYTNYGTAKTVSKAYEYDTVGRLTKSTIDGKATSYTYDAVGNRLTQTSEGKTLSYSYNNLNQLTSIKEGNTTVASYTYDANGNQKKETRQHVSVTVGGKTQVYNKETDYTYDLRGLLTGVSVKTPSANEITGEVTYDTQTTTNTYNAAGKRLKRVEENKTTRFYYMGEALLFTTNQDLVMTSENVLNTGGRSSPASGLQCRG